MSTVDPVTSIRKHAHHRTERRPAYGVYCYDCRQYVTTYDP